MYTPFLSLSLLRVPWEELTMPLGTGHVPQWRPSPQTNGAGLISPSVLCKPFLKGKSETTEAAEGTPAVSFPGTPEAFPLRLGFWAAASPSPQKGVCARDSVLKSELQLLKLEVKSLPDTLRSRAFPCPSGLAQGTERQPAE